MLVPLLSDENTRRKSERKTGRLGVRGERNFGLRFTCVSLSQTLMRGVGVGVSVGDDVSPAGSRWFLSFLCPRLFLSLSLRRQVTSAFQFIL